MKPVVFSLAAYLPLVLSGCLSDEALGAPEGAESHLAPRFTLADGSLVALGTEPLLWQGNELSADGAECCQTLRFRLELPEGYWDANPGSLEVSIAWDPHDEGYDSSPSDPFSYTGYFGGGSLHMNLEVNGPGSAGVSSSGGPYSRVALIPNAAPGEYTITVTATSWTGSYQGVVQIEPVKPSEGETELLPNMMMLPPRHLKIEHPLVRETSPALEAAGHRGCGPDETAEDQTIRCLRFASRLGTTGPGPIELLLPRSEWQAAHAGMGHWLQRIYRADGSYLDEPAGLAVYHPTHGHYHHEGMARSVVYAYDEASATRGDLVADGGKTGFCLINGGLVSLGEPGTSPPRNFDGGCCYYVAFCELDRLGDAFHMGITEGWYDVYPWWRADQYVEISDLEDGTYELETTVNPDGVIRETDTGDNAASVVFRLKGDTIEIVSEQ